MQLMLASLLFEADVFESSAEEKDISTSGKIFGIWIVLFKSLLDSLALVYMDYFFKFLSTSGFPYPLQQVYCAVWGLVLGIIFFMVQNNFRPFQTRGPFDGWTTGAWISAFTTAFYGVLVSLVLRYLDSLIKMLQSLLAVVVTILFDMVYFGQQINIVKFVEICFVLMSIFLYKIGTVTVKK